MRHPHRSYARVIAIAVPAEQPKVNLVYALTAGTLATIAVYILATLLS